MSWKGISAACVGIRKRDDEDDEIGAEKADMHCHKGVPGRDIELDAAKVQVLPELLPICLAGG